MFGIVGSMIFLSHPPLIYIGLMILITILLNVFSGKLLARGDTESLGWIILGCGLISLPRLFIFLMFFLTLLSVYLVYKYSLNVWGLKTPGLPVLTGAFFLTALIIC